MYINFVCVSVNLIVLFPPYNLHPTMHLFNVIQCYAMSQCSLSALYEINWPNTFRCDTPWQESSMQIEVNYIDCREDDTKFACVSGQCLPRGLQCDGIKHCEDQSDETTLCGELLRCYTLHQVTGWCGQCWNSCDMNDVICLYLMLKMHIVYMIEFYCTSVHVLFLMVSNRISLIQSKIVP